MDAHLSFAWPSAEYEVTFVYADGNTARLGYDTLEEAEFVRASSLAHIEHRALPDVPEGLTPKYPPEIDSVKEILVRKIDRPWPPERTLTEEESWRRSLTVSLLVGLRAAEHARATEPGEARDEIDAHLPWEVVCTMRDGAAESAGYYHAENVAELVGGLLREAAGGMTLNVPSELSHPLIARVADVESVAVRFRANV